MIGMVGAAWQADTAIGATASHSTPVSAQSTAVQLTGDTATGAVGSKDAGGTQGAVKGSGTAPYYNPAARFDAETYRIVVSVARATSGKFSNKLALSVACTKRRRSLSCLNHSLKDAPAGWIISRLGVRAG